MLFSSRWRSDSLHLQLVSIIFAKSDFPSEIPLIPPIRGSYPAQSMVIFSPFARRTSRTVIWFLVSVHVLSEQIVVTAPSVSTAQSFFTMTDFPARTDAPSASAIVIVVGSPSGTAAIAMETAYIRFSTICPVPSRNATIANRMKQMTTVIFATNLPIFLSSFWRGESTFSVSTASWAISPNLVLFPIFSIRNTPLHLATPVPIKTLSPRDLFTGTLSPVRAASSIRRE